MQKMIYDIEKTCNLKKKNYKKVSHQANRTNISDIDGNTKSSLPIFHRRPNTTNEGIYKYFIVRQ